MNQSTYNETTVGEVVNVARELYDALIDARPSVVGLMRLAEVIEKPERAVRAADILDRIDGALADAAGLFSQVQS